MKSILSISAMACAAFLASPAGAAGVYSAATTSNTNLSSSGGTPVAVLSIQVPQGSWIVNAKAGVVNFGNEDYARCQLTVNGTGHNGDATMNGYASSQPAVASVSIVDLVSTTGTEVFTLQCSHDNSGAGEYVDAGASMVISRAPKK